MPKEKKEKNPTVLQRVRVYLPTRQNPQRYCFGRLVPNTVGAIILDGRTERVVQVDPKDIAYPGDH